MNPEASYTPDIGDTQDIRPVEVIDFGADAARTTALIQEFTSEFSDWQRTGQQLKTIAAETDTRQNDIAAARNAIETAEQAITDFKASKLKELVEAAALVHTEVRPLQSGLLEQYKIIRGLCSEITALENEAAQKHIDREDHTRQCTVLEEEIGTTNVLRRMSLNQGYQEQATRLEQDIQNLKRNLLQEKSRRDKTTYSYEAVIEQIQTKQHEYTEEVAKFDHMGEIARQKIDLTKLFKEHVSEMGEILAQLLGEAEEHISTYRPNRPLAEVEENLQTAAADQTRAPDSNVGPSAIPNIPSAHQPATKLKLVHFDKPTDT